MASQEEHNKKAVHNHNFFNSIKTDIYPDWAIIVYFYRSIHLIESILAKRDLHPSSHTNREDLIIKHSDLISNDVRINYNNLKSLSHLARYKPEYGVTNENLIMAQECVDVITEWHRRMS